MGCVEADRDDADADWLRSATIITGEPNELVARLHDRMPVILPEEAWDDVARSGERATPRRLTTLLVPFPAEETAAYPVDTLGQQCAE